MTDRRRPEPVRVLLRWPDRRKTTQDQDRRQDHHVQKRERRHD